jgi:hypothetical protein
MPWRSLNERIKLSTGLPFLFLFLVVIPISRITVKSAIRSAWTWNQKDLDEDEEVEENDYWYVGKIPPMGANVAFSLYGHLKSKSGSFNGCTKDTFINSFYTRTGFTAFITAMKAAGASGFSSLSSSSFTAECQGGYGVGCDKSGNFVVHKYSSSICDPQNVTSTTNQLSSLNSAMKTADCNKIYTSSYTSSSYSSSSSSSSGSSSSSSSYSGTALALLDYSAACFYQNFFSPDGSCPDPFGKISYYQTNFYKTIQKAKAQRPVSVYRQKLAFEEEISAGRTKVGTGLALMVLAAGVLIIDKLFFDVIKPVARKVGKSVQAMAKAFSEDDSGDVEKNNDNDNDRTSTVRSGESSNGDGDDSTRFM